MALEKLKTAKALDRWVEIFKGAFKGATVDAHEGQVDADALKRMSVKLPAIFVAAIQAPSSADVGDDTNTYDTIFSAFILTGDEHRAITGLNMSEAVRILVKTSVSKIDGVGKAKQITWQNILSAALPGKLVSLNAVAWRQPIQLGEQSTADIMFTGGQIWPDNVIPENLYIEHDGVIDPEKPSPAPEPE